MNRIGPSGAIQVAINKNLNGHGIFWQSKERNKLESKKIDYKTRKLRYPLRQPNEDEILAQMEAEKEEEKKKFNRDNKNFIRKNRERYKAKSQEKQNPHGTTDIKPGTVTLTQEQLTALLASLGKSGAGAGKDNPIKIKIDAANNKIELEKLDSNDYENKAQGDRNRHHEKRDRADSDSETEIGIGALLEQGKPLKKEMDSDKQKRQNEMNEYLKQRSGNSEAAHTTKQETETDSVPANIPWKHLTVAERKRLQWARERAEQEEYNPWGRPGAGAPVRKQEEAEVVVPQAPAVLTQNTSRSFVDPEMKRKQDTIAREIAQLQKEIQEMERKKKAEEERILKELLAKKKVTEDSDRAKRSNKEEITLEKSKDNDSKVQTESKGSNKNNLEARQEINEFKMSKENLTELQAQNIVRIETEASPRLLTGPATGLRLGDGQDELLSKKEMERKKWIAELDKQREEQRIKKQLEKERDKTGVQDQWADRFVYHKTFEQVSPRLAPASQRSKEQNQVSSSPNVAVVESHVPPAAMRSSMVIGTGTLNDKRYESTKAEEKKKWLQELELQREEQRLAKLAQNERNKQEDGTWADKYPSDHFKQGPAKDNKQDSGIWMDPYPSDHKKLHPVQEDTGGVWMDPYPSDHKKLHTVKEDTGGVWMDPYPSDYKKLHPQQRDQEESQAPNHQEHQRTNSAPNSTLQQAQKESNEGQSFLRGQVAFIDPVTRKEQEEKRKAQLAYQAQVKAQIEEKERKKKEEKLRKMQEDMEEERKLQMEREVLNRQSEFEQKKMRDREELRQKQIDVLKTAMEEAQEKATEEKNVRRLHHLQQHGHDVSQLKAKYGEPCVSKVTCSPGTKSTAALAAPESSSKVISPCHENIASSPRKKEFEMSSIPGLSNYVPPESLNRKAGPSLPPSFPVEHNTTSRFDPADHTERNIGQDTYSFDPYVEDRVLTPSRFRDPSRPKDLPDSPRREFGTQTFELKDLKAILEKLPEEVQIEYKFKVEEALREKELGKQAPPPRKVHAKAIEETAKDVKKTAAAKAVKSAPKEKTLKLNERPDWNQRKRKTAIKNSEKDPFYEQKREEAEARRLKRERQLLYLQEINKERIPNLSRSPGRSPRDVSPEAVMQVGERGRKPAAGPKKGPQAETLRYHSPSLLNDKDKKKKSSPRSTSPPIPSVKHKAHTVLDPSKDPYQYINSYLRTSQGDTKYGDVPLEPHTDEFVPFMRTTEVLDPSRADEPVAISRENSRMEKARRAYYENFHPANKGKKLDIYQDSERESTLKASQNLMGATYVTPRQDMILQQLSSLKKTLMERQKELEDYMLPSALDHENLRG